MKDVLMFHLYDCGYCRKAMLALEELMAENPAYRAVPLTKIEETEQPAMAEAYNYYAVPTFYVGGEKVFEAHIGMGYEEIKAACREVLERAMA